MEDFKLIVEQKLSDGSFVLKPTQSKISLPIAFRIYKKMKANLKFDAIKICDELLIDGHHRYIASVIAGVSIERFQSTKNLTQSSFEWADVSLITVDYDESNLIDYHNYNDALRNDVTVAYIKKILE